MKVSIGFVLVTSKRGFSFRILKRTPSTEPQIIKGMDTPLWFPNKKAAKSCARALIVRVKEQLRMSGMLVETYES